VNTNLAKTIVIGVAAGIALGAVGMVATNSFALGVVTGVIAAFIVASIFRSRD